MAQRAAMMHVFRANYVAGSSLEEHKVFGKWTKFDHYAMKAALKEIRCAIKAERLNLVHHYYIS